MEEEKLTELGGLWEQKPNRGLEKRRVGNNFTEHPPFSEYMYYYSITSQEV